MKELSANPQLLCFDRYIGDPDLKARLREPIEAAKAQGILPPHMLFSGLPETGSATFAMIIAKVLNLPVFRFSGCELKTASQFKELLKTPECGALVFIDGIDAISHESAELLCSIMKDRQMSSPTDPTLIFYLNPLMAIGATTAPASLEKPLLDLFTLKFTIPPLPHK